MHIARRFLSASYERRELGPAQRPERASKRYSRIIGSAVGLALALCAGSAQAARLQNCHGCLGSGGQDMAVGTGECSGASIAITVHVVSGLCFPISNPPLGFAGCTQISPCTVTVFRSWAGLPANCAFDFCVQPPGQPTPWCLTPQPDSGSGTGSHQQETYEIGCKDSTWTWSITTAGCCDSMSASVTGGCSKCTQ